jgi:two-component system NtrC family sensor kinase
MKSNEEKQSGLLSLKPKQTNEFCSFSHKGLAQTLGIALLNQRAQAALRERVKELTCLYSLVQFSEQPGIALDKLLQGIAELLPPGWHYPEVTVGRITLDGKVYSTQYTYEERHIQKADITVKGKKRGAIEVVYTVEKPMIDEGPFLREERSLINAIARQVSLIIERREAEEDRTKLQNQLRHADRLATIGQLVAGVAHELNEPLGNILGFAQLTQKIEGLPDQAKQDIDKIVSASLYAREVIKKLMLFARQTPPSMTEVNLNQIVEEGLYFFEARCTKACIKLIRSLSPDLPHITADPTQLNQILINLVVNAIQAMPDGGELKVQTLSHDNKVSLIVEDTGNGMSEDIIKQLFVPFFTTKDVDLGTGLGLAVVHGIVTSHQGSVNVESQVGKGSKFEIQLPISGTQENRELV